MKIVDCQQQSLDWLQARVGIPTASEFDNLVTPKFEVRKGAMVESFLAQKVAEAWLNSPLPGFNTIDMEFGKILEEEGRPRLAWELGVDIQTVGFVTTDDGRIGCSPDGLIGDDGGCEIKCPEAKTHARYLLDGVLPPDYAAQVQGSMFVTGRPYWVFFSYRRKFPPLILRVERDEKAQNALKEALESFLARFDAAIARLVELNGGRPVARSRANATPIPQPQPESEDLIP